MDSNDNAAPGNKLGYRIVLFAWCTFASLGATHAPLPMSKHMQILGDPQKEPELARLPTIRIGRIVSEVDVDDRIDADKTFDRSFVDALAEGIGWYLAERGLRVVREGGDLRLRAAIIAYEGDRGWGEWGVDMTLAVTLRSGSGEIITDELRSALMYSDGHTLRNEFKKEYTDQGLYLRYFREILLTRIGIDLSEQLITLIVDRKTHPRSSRTPLTDLATEGQGLIAIDSSVANAEVLIDGLLIGTTPLQDVRLPAGLHTIEIRKSGFREWIRDVLIIAGGKSNLVVELNSAEE